MVNFDLATLQDQILDLFIAAPLKGDRLKNPLARTLQTIFQDEKIRRVCVAAGQKRPAVAVVLPLLTEEEAERALKALLSDCLALEQLAVDFDAVDPSAAEDFRIAVKFLRDVGKAVQAQADCHASPHAQTVN